jgi:hypothetical protein
MMNQARIKELEEKLQQVKVDEGTFIVSRPT